MACLRKVKNKQGFVYHIDYTYKGRRYVMSTKTSDYTIARQILKDIEGKIARGIFDLDTTAKKNILLSKYSQEYFKYAESYKSKATIVNEKNYVAKLNKYLGDVAIGTISVKDLDLWKADSLKKISAATFNIERRTLQSIFEVARRWNYIRENPFKNIKKAKVEEKRFYFEPDEFNKIIKLVSKDEELSINPRDKRFLCLFRLYILFLVNTGLRRSEALRLRKVDVDFKKGIIHISKTKSKQARIVPLNKVSRMILESLSDDLFAGLNANHVSRKFNHYLRKAKMTQFKLHSLRHTFATDLIARGVDIYTVSRLLGHSDIRTSMVYAKTKVELLKDAVNKLDIHLLQE